MLALGKTNSKKQSWTNDSSSWGQMTKHTMLALWNTNRKKQSILKTTKKLTLFWYSPLCPCNCIQLCTALPLIMDLPLPPHAEYGYSESHDARPPPFKDLLWNLSIPVSAQMNPWSKNNSSKTIFCGGLKERDSTVLDQWCCKCMECQACFALSAKTVSATDQSLAWGTGWGLVWCRQHSAWRALFCRRSASWTTGSGGTVGTPRSDWKQINASRHEVAYI